MDTLKYHNERLTKRIEVLQSSASRTRANTWSLLGSSNLRRELELELNVLKQELYWNFVFKLVSYKAVENHGKRTAA